MKVYRNNYEGHMDNNKGEWKQGKEVGKAGVVAKDGGKGRKLYLNNSKKSLKKEIVIIHIGIVWNNKVFQIVLRVS